MDGFTDADLVSDWALPAIEWAFGNDYVHGRGGNVLDPQGIITRAEVAQILLNYGPV